MSRIKFFLASFLLLTLIGCSKSDKKDEAQTQPPATAPAPQPAAQSPDPAQQPTPIPAGQPVEATPQPKSQPAARTASAPAPPRAPARAPARQDDIVTPPAQTPSGSARSAIPSTEPVRPRTAVLPAGTRIEVRLAQAISSNTNKSGEKFEALLERDLEVDGRVLVPKGSTVIGKLSGVEEGGKVEGRARLSMSLVEIQVKGESYPIDTNTLTFEAEGSKKEDAIKIGGGAGIGAAIGAIAGGKKGAAIGAAIGGGAGTATVLATKGKQVEFEAEKRFSFRLEQDVPVKLR